MANKSSAIKVFTYFTVVDETGEGHPVNINVQIQEGSNRGVFTTIFFSKNQQHSSQQRPTNMSTRFFTKSQRTDFGLCISYPLSYLISMLLLSYIFCSHPTLLLLSNFFMMELLPLNFGGRDRERELRARFSYRETRVYMYYIQ